MQQESKSKELIYDIRFNNKTIPVEVDLTETELTTDEIITKELVNYILIFENIRTNLGEQQ